MKKYAIFLASALAASTAVHAEDTAPAAAAADSKQLAAEKEKSTSADYVIMKIGADEIKRSEIEKVWKVIFPGGNAPNFDTLDSRIKNNLLRGVANEHIILSEAKKSTLMDTPEFKERLRTAENQILIQEFLKDKTKEATSDDKLKALYDAQIKSHPSNTEEVHARHILLKTEADAKAVAKKLKKGGDFAAIAKEKSEDKASGVSGGDLGWFTAERMTPEFSKAAFALKKGEVSEPVKTDFGWHIIKLEERRVSPPPTFEMLKEELKAQLGRKAVADYIATLTKDVKVTVMDEKGAEKPLAQDPPMAVPAISPATGKAAE